jgi:hypothetical protein
MLGIAVMLLFSPFYFGALFFGLAIGAAIRIRQRRRRAAAMAASPRSRSGAAGGQSKRRRAR